MVGVILSAESFRGDMVFFFRVIVLCVEYDLKEEQGKGDSRLGCVYICPLTFVWGCALSITIR